jgi:WD40 repeat protein
MNLAQHAWDAGGVERVRKLLERHRPKAGEPDLRSFEWHYLNRLCHSELFTVERNVAFSPNRNVAFSPDGRRVASSAPWGVKVWDAQTGQELLALKGGGSVVAYSPDGQRLVGVGSGEIKVWDA